MTKNQNRTVVQSTSTSDGAIQFKLYSTGSLVACFATAGLSKNGADTAFARINNLKVPEVLDVLPKLYKVLEQVAHPKMSTTVEYQANVHSDLLDYLINDEVDSPELRWVTFVASIAEIKIFTIGEIKTLAKENEPRLEETIESNAYRFFFRPDLGYFSQRDRTKVLGLTEFKVRRAAIQLRLSQPVYKLAKERVESGVITANLATFAKVTESYSGYSGAAYGASMILTAAEMEEFKAILKKNSFGSYSIADEPSILLGYTYLTLGAVRAEEVLQFFGKYQNAENQQVWSRYMDFNTMEHPQGKISFDIITSTIDSLKDDASTPFEWAVELEI